jgi:hypothetical protein
MAFKIIVDSRKTIHTTTGATSLVRFLVVSDSAVDPGYKVTVVKYDPCDLRVFSRTAPAGAGTPKNYHLDVVFKSHGTKSSPSVKGEGSEPEGAERKHGVGDLTVTIDPNNADTPDKQTFTTTTVP